MSMGDSRRAFYLFSLSLLTAGVGLISTIVLSHSMSIEEYGTYAYLLSFATLGGVFASFGTPTLVTREVAQFFHKGALTHIKGVLLFSVIVLSIGTVCVGTSFWLVIHNVLGRNQSGGAEGVLEVTVVLLYLVQFRSICVSALNGISEQIRQAVPTLIGGIAFLLSLLIFRIHQSVANPFVVIVLQSIAVLISIALQLRELGKTLSWQRLSKTRAIVRWRQWGRESLQFLGAGVAFAVNAQVDVFLLGTIRGPKFAGPYQVGTKAASVLVLALGALASIYQPLISKAHFSGDNGSVQTSATSISRTGFLMALAFAAVALPNRKTLLTAIFGKSYGVAAPILGILIIGRLANASVGAVGPYLSMTEKGGVLMIALVVESVLNIAGNLVLIPIYGAVGAAIATSASMVLVNFSAAIYIKKKFGANMFFI